MNMAPTIIPKSDQLNADDLISGPITVKILAVNSGSKEQPVSIVIDGYEGRPYKPSKSMRRVLVTLWGNDASAYIGRRLTLFRDPSVKFGADLVGGIKISHVSDITEAASIVLTVTRGSRKPYTVKPIADAPGFDATGFPAAWVEWSNEERGDFMATQGLARLKEWWATLTPAEQKPLKPRLDNDWKPSANKP